MSDIKKALQDVQSWPKERLAQFLQQLPQLAEVLDERVHQDAKHGVQIRPPFEYAMILQEEVGEYQKEVTEGYYDGVEFKPELRAELVQVAAVALAALFSYDTRTARVAAGFTADMATPAERHAYRMRMADALHSEPTPAPDPIEAQANAAYNRQTFGPSAAASMGWIKPAPDMSAVRAPEGSAEVHPTNLVAGLSGEIERVAEIEKEYRSLGKAGELAAALMAADLKKGREALASGNIAEMVVVYKELQGYSL